MRPVIDKPTNYSKVTWKDNEADRCNDRPLKNILEVFGGLDSKYVRNDSNSKLSKYGKYFVGFFAHSGRIMCQRIEC